jgi:hypothetical protein
MYSIIPYLLRDGWKICYECSTIYDPKVSSKCPTCEHWKVKAYAPNVKPNKHVLGVRKQKI